MQESSMQELQELHEVEQEVLTIELVGQRFKEWRARKTKRERIPLELWEQAINLTSQHPISEVCKNLRLSFNDLKNHVLAKAEISRDLLSGSPYPFKEPGVNFLELKLDGANSMPTLPNLSMFRGRRDEDTEKSSCLMELSKSDGSTLKIYSSIGIVEKMERIDINRICETFLKG